MKIKDKEKYRIYSRKLSFELRGGLVYHLFLIFAYTKLCALKTGMIAFSMNSASYPAFNSGQWVEELSTRLVRPHHLSAISSWQGFQFSFCTLVPGPIYSLLGRHIIWHAAGELCLLVEWHHKTTASKQTSPVIPHQLRPQCCSCHTWW